MILPAAIHLIWWTAIPMVATLALGFTDYDVLSGAASFVGVANFIEIFGDDAWLRAMWQTVVFTFFTVPVSMSVAMVVASLLNAKLRGASWYRAAYFLPQVTATVSVAMVWIWMYDARVGLFNAILALFGITGPAWLADPQWALAAVIIMSIWKSIGVQMLIYLAALQSIPTSVYEAASVDGAGPLRRFWSITVPMLRPATFFVFIVSIIEAFQAFDQIYVMTPDGGPANSTTVMTYEIYRMAFEDFRLGTASAQSIVLFVFLLVVTLAGRRLIGRDERD